MDENLTLSVFLKENALEIEPVGYVASKRFVKDGKPVEWKLKPVSNEFMDKLSTKCIKHVPIKGTRDVKKEFDNVKFMEELALATVIYPNLNDASLQDSYGVLGAADLVRAMLTPGEWSDLQFACSEANDYQSGMEDKLVKANN